MLKGKLTLVLALALICVLVSAASAQTIVHWQHHHEARTPALESLARQFEAENPGVQVKIEAIPFDSYFDKLLTALAAGTGPDVFQVPMAFGTELTRSGMISPVPETVYTTEQIEELFLDWTISQFKYNGKYYALPTDVQTLVMFVNNKMLREAGLDPEQPPRTWSELLEQARKVTIRDEQGRIIQGGLDTRYKWAVHNLFIHQNIEGPILDLENKRVTYDQPAGLEAWKFVAELITGPEAVDSPTFLTGQMKFEQEKAAFYINHPVTRGRLELNHPDIDWSVHPVPMPDGSDELITVGHHWAYVANAKSADSELAWKWIKYLASEEAQRLWVLEARDLPSMIKLVNDPDLTPDEAARVAMESLKYARPYEAVGRNDVDEIRNNIWDNIAIGGMDVEEAVKAGAAQENQLIQRKLR